MPHAALPAAPSLPDRSGLHGAPSSRPPLRPEDLGPCRLHRPATVLTPGEDVDLPDLGLDPAWTFETLNDHLRANGQGPAPGDASVVHVAYARDDLTTAIRRLDVVNVVRLLSLPGLRASRDALDAAMGVNLMAGLPGTTGLAERMLAQETIVALFLAGGAPASEWAWENAVASGNPRLLVRLLAEQPSPLPASQAQVLLVHLVARNRWSSGAAMMDRLLLEGARINPEDRDPLPGEKSLQPPLSTACEHGNLLRVQDLLDRGADPNRRRPDGAPPLYSAIKEDNPEITMALLRAGADLHATIPAKGRTMLERAVLTGALRSIGRMLDEGLDPLAPSSCAFPEGEAPATLAAVQHEEATTLGYPPRCYGAALLDRLMLMRSGTFPGNFGLELSEPAQQCLERLEAHGLQQALNGLGLPVARPSDAGTSRRRL